MKKLCAFFLLCITSFTVLADALKPRYLSLDLCNDWMFAYFMPSNTHVSLSPIHRSYPSHLIGIEHKKWPIHTGLLEEIVTHRPTTIVAGQYNAMGLRNRLSQLGFNVVIFSHPDSLDAIEQYQHEFLTAVGLPVTLTVPKPARVFAPKNGRLLILGANGIGTGKGTLEDELLTYAGWKNYLTQNGNVNLSLEQLVTDPPDAILFSAPKSRALANQFANHPVLKKSVVMEDWIDSDYWRWMCPGPWTWDLINQLGNIQLSSNHRHD